MSTLSSTITIGKPHAGRGGTVLPGSRRGGDEGGGNAGLPIPAQRLRRARLGIVVAITPIVMLFVSFTERIHCPTGIADLRRGHHQLCS